MPIYIQEMHKIFQNMLIVYLIYTQDMLKIYSKYAEDTANSYYPWAFCPFYLNYSILIHYYCHMTIIVSYPLCNL